MELWDVLDEHGEKTGRTIWRGQMLPPGDFHLVVHIWISNEQGDYLIQKRAEHLEWKPGMWAATGGSVIAGEDSLAGALRETHEELGLVLDATYLSRIARLVRFDSNSIVDVWLAEVSGLVVGDLEPGPEVSEVKWVSRSELGHMVSVGDFYRHSYLEWLLDRPISE